MNPITIEIKTNAKQAVEEVFRERNALQASINPITIPVIYQKGNSFSDKPFVDELNLEVIKRGRRG